MDVPSTLLVSTYLSSNFSVTDRSNIISWGEELLND